jgi:hypothetical protein
MVIEWHPKTGTGQSQTNGRPTWDFNLLRVYEDDMSPFPLRLSSYSLFPLLRGGGYHPMSLGRKYVRRDENKGEYWRKKDEREEVKEKRIEKMVKMYGKW